MTLKQEMTISIILTGFMKMYLQHHLNINIKKNSLTTQIIEYHFTPGSGGSTTSDFILPNLKNNIIDKATLLFNE